MAPNWKSDYVKEKDRREQTARKIAQEHGRTSDDELICTPRVVLEEAHRGR
jgi:hypothetical protein